MTKMKDFINAIKGKNREKEKEVLEETLRKAYDIRKFELDIYWKRATYFWAFIAASFTAYFFAIDPNKGANIFNQFLILCIGFIFSLSWYLVNRGSTYWTTHWERVIDAIEKELGTELYKFNLKNENSVFAFWGHYSHSVSRINIMVSFFICTIWFGLMVKFILKIYVEIEEQYYINLKILLPFVLTITIAVYLIFGTKSKRKSKFSFHERTSEYLT